MTVRNMFRLLTVVVCAYGCVKYYEMIPLGGWITTTAVLCMAFTGTVAFLNLIFLCIDLWSSGDRKKDEKHTGRPIMTTITVDGDNTTVKVPYNMYHDVSGLY